MQEVSVLGRAGRGCLFLFPQNEVCEQTSGQSTGNAQEIHVPLWHQRPPCFVGDIVTEPGNECAGHEHELQLPWETFLPLPNTWPEGKLSRTADRPRRVP